MENPGINIPFQGDKKIVLRVAGDLHLMGSSEAEIFVSTYNPRRLKVNEEGGLVRIASNEDAWVRVPAGAAVRVEHVGGDATVFGLTGQVEINQIGGDLRYNGAEKLDIGQVGGDLAVAGVSGALTVRRGGGEFTCDVPGSIAVEMVGSDSDLRVQGAVRLRSGGDISMNIDGSSADEVVLKAGGDVELFAGEGMKAQLDLTSGGRGREILLGAKHDFYAQGKTGVSLGTGGRMIRVKAGGDITVSDHLMDMKDIGREFERFEQEFNEMGKERFFGSERIHDPQYWADFENRIRERAEEAARRAEERVRMVMERVERDNRRREEKFGRNFGRGFGFQGFEVDFHGEHSHGGHPEQPASPMEPSAEVPAPVVENSDAAYGFSEVTNVTTEERMLVLKMLQEHKITVEEAEQLLAEFECEID